MFMLSLFISFLMVFCGLYVFCSSRKHLLMVLLSLEFMVISFFFLMSNYLLMFDYELFFIVIFMLFSVCEGALGLSILVSMVRFYGNDFFGSFNLNLC